MASERKIIHLDMDAFFASVEQRDNPALAGQPLAVGGTPDGRGVVAAASYEARAFGVRSAMPSAKAKRLCPHLRFVRPRIDRYREVSRQMRAILDDYTDIIEPLSLDECYLDVTHNKVGMVFARDIAADIRRRIRAELHLTASAGVGSTKLVAKIASDMDKPDGLFVVRPEEEAAFLAPLPIEKLWGVGPATAKRLHALGVRTFAQLGTADPDLLADQFGKQGPFLQRLARGDDPREVRTHRERKSFGRERTFEEDLTVKAHVVAEVQASARKVAGSLVAAGRPASTVTLKLRYADFSTISRSQSLPTPTHDAAVLEAVAVALVDRTEAGDRPVRLVGVSAKGLASKGAAVQLGLPFTGDHS